MNLRLAGGRLIQVKHRAKTTVVSLGEADTPTCYHTGYSQVELPPRKLEMQSKRKDDLLLLCLGESDYPGSMCLVDVNVSFLARPSQCQEVVSWLFKAPYEVKGAGAMTNVPAGGAMEDPVVIRCEKNPFDDFHQFRLMNMPSETTFVPVEHENFEEDRYRLMLPISTNGGYRMDGDYKEGWFFSNSDVCAYDKRWKSWVVYDEASMKAKQTYGQLNGAHSISVHHILPATMVDITPSYMLFDLSPEPSFVTIQK
jgi:hypothetical protein